MKIAVLVSMMLALSAIALAQTPNPAPSSGDTETIYDYGRRIRDNDLSQRFVHALLHPSFNLEGQFATWKRPICLHVEGMAFPDAYFVEQRISDIALKVGAPLNRNPACFPNIVIFVSPDQQLALDTMKAKKPFLFAGQALSELKVHYPVQAWYFTVDRDYNGHYWPDVPPDPQIPDPSRVLDGIPAMASNNTRLRTGIQPELRTATILVDSVAIKSLSLASFADYVALMSLSQAPANGHCQPAPSIANLFLTDCEVDFHVPSLSNADLAMLISLYETPAEPERLQQTRLIENMRRHLEAMGNN